MTLCQKYNKNDRKASKKAQLKVIFNLKMF